MKTKTEILSEISAAMDKYAQEYARELIPTNDEIESMFLGAKQIHTAKMLGKIILSKLQQFKSNNMKPKKQITITEIENDQCKITIDHMSLVEAVGHLTVFRDMIQIELMKRNEELTINK